MSLISMLRCVTVDVTGTLLAFKGELGDYYCMVAKAVGLPCSDYKCVHEGFKLAYSEMTNQYPCFGHAAKMPNIIWWKKCVMNSFKRYFHNDRLDMSMMRGHFKKIFRRIYSSFGSSAPCVIFPDSISFLRSTRAKGIPVGLVSNAEYRYQDVILPALGLHKGSEWDFGVLSGIEGVEKPNPKIYELALERAGNVVPEDALHIGDSLSKDCLAAKSLGMHAILLDRFKTPDADNWRKEGVPVYPGLASLQELLGSDNLLIFFTSSCMHV